MPTFLYDILTSPLFYIAVAIWIIVDIAAEKKRQNLLNSLDGLFYKPVIFEEDDKPEEKIPFYARGILYKAATGVQRALQEPFKGVIDLLKTGIDYLVNNIKEEDKPLLFMGYILSFILFIIYFYLDTIAVVTALIANGLVSPDFPEIFQRFQYVAIGGSLFALLIGFYTLAQMTQQHSDLSGWDRVRGLWRAIARFMVFTLIVLGLFAVIFLSFQLMLSLGFFSTESSTINGLVAFASTVLTRINVAFASILLLQDGIMGFVLLGVVILAVFWATFKTLQFILRPIGIIIFFVADIIYRLLLLAVFLLWFIITTPILLFVSLFRRLNEEDEASNVKSRGQSVPSSKAEQMMQYETSEKESQAPKKDKSRIG